MLRVLLPLAILLSGCGIKGDLATPPPLFGKVPIVADETPDDAPLNSRAPVTAQPGEVVPEEGLADPAPHYGPDLGDGEDEFDEGF